MLHTLICRSVAPFESLCPAWLLFYRSRLWWREEVVEQVQWPDLEEFLRWSLCCTCHLHCSSLNNPEVLDSDSGISTCLSIHLSICLSWGIYNPRTYSSPHPPCWASVGTGFHPYSQRQSHLSSISVLGAWGSEGGWWLFMNVLNWAGRCSQPARFTDPHSLH